MQIPRAKLPPQEYLEYYASAANRGYLADPAAVQRARLELAHKYGYALRDARDPLLALRKGPRQIFYGLEAGAVVNLPDRQILRPTQPELRALYNS